MSTQISMPREEIFGFLLTEDLREERPPYAKLMAD